MDYRQHPSHILKGLPAAPGLAMGRLVIFKEQALILPDPYPVSDPAAAYGRLREAVEAVKIDLTAVRSRIFTQVGKDESAIFDAQLMMVEDVALHEMVKAEIDAGVNPEAAWHTSIESFAHMLEELPDPLLSARAVDVRDIGQRVLGRLLCQEIFHLELHQPAILAGRDFTPSQTASLDPQMVLAFCTAEGGPTSHTAILAKALGKPAVVALGPNLFTLNNGDMLLVDAGAGSVMVNPSAEQQQDFERRMTQAVERTDRDRLAAQAPAVTRDGLRVEVFANIGNAAEAAAAVAAGAEGVGLFRTEFLYLNRKEPLELDQQMQQYRAVIAALGGRPLVVRTLDIGGDKRVDYLSIVEEPNPFLGWRGIRMISERPDILRQQLYAILKAAQNSDIRIMLPMVTVVAEVIQARAIFEEVLSQVRGETPEYTASIQFGMMVEVPAAALTVEHFAPYVDFYSIGTNDLTQYTLAADRMNARVAPVASAFAPAVLRLIERTVRVAHTHNKWVGMCGEFAGEPAAAPFLLGIGLDEFSMAPAAIPAAKRTLRALSTSECQPIARRALELPDAESVKTYLEQFINF
jgi:phosphoenolpyruvate-protein phosphotransferase